MLAVGGENNYTAVTGQTAVLQVKIFTVSVGSAHHMKMEKTKIPDWCKEATQKLNQPLQSRSFYQ